MEPVILDGVRLERDGAVAIVTFARPPLNHFDEAMLCSIGEALERIDGTPDMRAVALFSEGRTFCAGADLGDGEIDPGPLYRQALRIFAARKPIVAGVQGAAIGGGLGVALVADFRVVTPETRMCANFVSLGIHPGFGLSVTLPRLIGQQKAAQMFLTGRRIKGEDAVAMGLAEEITTGENLRQRTLELAHELAAVAPLGVQSTRATLRRGLVEQIATALDIELAEQRRLFATADYKEGVRAVHERRPGRWQCA